MKRTRNPHFTVTLDYNLTTQVESFCLSKNLIKKRKNSDIGPAISLGIAKIVREYFKNEKKEK